MLLPPHVWSPPSLLQELNCTLLLPVCWLACYNQPQNRRNTPERLEIKKYNPNLRRYTVHREVK